jgi:acetoacetate decarboxylase
MADFPVREIVGASHIMTDLTLARAKRCHDYLDNAR